MSSFKIKNAFLISLLSVFVLSCDDEAAEVVDVSKPSISNIQYNETVEPGGVLRVNFVVKDETALGEVQIEIHDDFNGHDHDNARIKSNRFSYSNVLEEVRGSKEYTVEEEISIPEDASTGPYHIQISYFDAAGNEGESYIGNFEISSETVSPIISITNFEEDEDLHPTRNEDGTLILYLEGSIQSQVSTGLDEVHIVVRHKDESHSHGRIKHDHEDIYDEEWELEGAPHFDLSQIQPLIDFTDAEEGHYELRIVARDMEGNVKIVTREVHVH